MRKVPFCKIQGDEIIGSKVTEGLCDDLPELGVPFVMYAESLAFKGGFRLINTSPVQGIGYELDGTITITTENSTYQLTITEET